jgi:hypothetical protein
MDGRGIVRRSPWGLAVVALLGLAGCLPASRGWVREQLAEVQDRVVRVEQQVEGLNPKVDRILAQTEQRGQQSTVSSPHLAGTGVTFPLPSPSRMSGNLPVEVPLDFTVAAGAPPRAGGTILPSSAPVKALKPPPPGRAVHPDCLLKILKGEPCPAPEPRPPQRFPDKGCLLKILNGEPC